MGLDFFLGKSIKVQQLIGVDRVPTRAVEQILKQPGLTVGKVAILVGGPDWPTSVTCGILRLEIYQMLIGTLPVIIVSTPCVMAGALMARAEAGEDSIWSALANLFMAISAIGQMGSMFIAFCFITKVISRDGNELAKPRKEHDAVTSLTAAEAHFEQVYLHATSWDNLDPARKSLIASGAFLILLSGWVFALGSKYCFRSFALSSRIDDPYEEIGLDGNPMNIFLAPGWAALGVFGFAALCHCIFVCDRKSATKRQLTRKIADCPECPGR